MSDYEQAFLAAILDAPDDDAPRLLFADWLEENGRAERGEFIRVQCLLAKALPKLPLARADKRPFYTSRPYSQYGRDLMECRLTAEAIDPILPGDRVEVVHPEGVTRPFICVNVECTVNDYVRVELVSEGPPQQWTHEAAAKRTLLPQADIDVLRRRERELLEKRHELVPDAVHDFMLPYYRWVGSGGEGPTVARRGYSFRRGFVEVVNCTAEAFLTHAHVLTAAAPIRDVTLTTWPWAERVDGPYSIRPVWRLRGRYRLAEVDSSLEAVRALLTLEWPRVKTWNLPQDAGHVGVDPGDGRDFTAVQSLGGGPAAAP